MLTDHDIAQLMNSHSLQGGSNSHDDDEPRGGRNDQRRDDRQGGGQSRDDRNNDRGQAPRGNGNGGRAPSRAPSF